MKRCSILLPASAALVLFVPACGGGGGGDDAQAANGAVVAPSVVVTSPTVSGTTDEGEITVRGTADPGSGTIASILVAGVPATSTDGFATWSATVPVADGGNAYSVVVEDGDGDTHSFPVGVSIEGVPAVLVDPRAVVIDPVAGVALVADSYRQELIALDLDFGTRKVLSGPQNGNGPLFEAPVDLLLDAANQRVLVLDGKLDGILAIHLFDGMRELLVATSPAQDPSIASARGFGPSLTSPDLVLVMDGLDGLIEVDLSTGNLRQIADNSPAFGSPIISARGFAVDEARGTAYTLDSFTDNLFEIDVASGQRTIVPEPTSTFVLPRAIAFDPTQGLMVYDGIGELVQVDLPTGKRTLLSGSGVGSGDPLSSFSFDVEVHDGFAYLPDPDRSALARVDLTSGERTQRGGTFVGSGAFLDSVPDLATGRDDTLIAALPGAPDAIVAIDLATGDRVELAGPGDGGAEPLAGPRHVDVHPITGDVLFIDDGRVFRVDASTGQRQVVLEDGDLGISIVRDAVWDWTNAFALYVFDSSAQELLRVNLVTQTATVVASQVEGFEIFMEPFADRVVVLSSDDVHLVDVATGDAVRLTGTGTDASGLEIDTIGDVAVDSAAGVLYLRDEGEDQILKIDLATGERSLLCSEFEGDGPPVRGIGGIALSQDRRTLYAYDEGTESLLAVTIASGDRVMVAR